MRRVMLLALLACALALPASAEEAHKHNAKLEAIVPDGVVPVGFWRSVGHSHSAFFDESFVDEVAHFLKKDPFEFRRELLANQPSHRKVLETAAK